MVALSGLGVVVVKALGGEEVKLAQGTVLQVPAAATAATDVVVEREGDDPIGRYSARLPGDTTVVYPNGASVTRSEPFTIMTRSGPIGAQRSGSLRDGDSPLTPRDGKITLPEGVTQPVPGSSWGTFTIA